jgi:hypothetical protein
MAHLSQSPLHQTLLKVVRFGAYLLITPMRITSLAVHADGSVHSDFIRISTYELPSTVYFPQKSSRRAISLRKSLR